MFALIKTNYKSEELVCVIEDNVNISRDGTRVISFNDYVALLQEDDPDLKYITDKRITNGVVKQRSRKDFVEKNSDKVRRIDIDRISKIFYSEKEVCEYLLILANKESVNLLSLHTALNLTDSWIRKPSFSLDHLISLGLTIEPYIVKSPTFGEEASCVKCVKISTSAYDFYFHPNQLVEVSMLFLLIRYTECFEFDLLNKLFLNNELTMFNKSQLENIANI